MNAEQLILALGDIDDAAVLDAEEFSAVKTGRGLRRMVAIALAAALMLAMSITAVGYFSGAAWFETFFSWGKELTEEQGEYVTNTMMDIGSSVTVSGWTITLDKGMTDGSAALFSLFVQAPEDVDLTAVEYFFGEFRLKNTDSVVSNMTGSRQYEAWDTDGPVNTGEVALRFNISPEYRSFSLADGSECVLTIQDIRLQHPETFEELALIEGTWEFTFAFPESTGALELIGEPIMSNSGTVEITSCKLSPLGLWIETNAESEEAEKGVIIRSGDYSDYENLDLDYKTPRVVMKDGTEYAVGGHSGSVTIGAAGVRRKLHYTFHTPILLEEADYLLFNDGTKIDLN